MSERICNLLIKGEIISSEDYALYEYGLEQGFSLLLNIITTIVVGVFFGMLPYGVLFLLTYAPLRSYAGGYHAKTRFRCYVLSTAIIVLALIGIKYLVLTKVICLLILIVTGFIIALFAPVQDSNRPLNDKEIIKFTRKAREILFAEIIICFVSLFFNIAIVYKSIVFSLITLSIMLIMGKVKNINENKKLNYDIR